MNFQSFLFATGYVALGVAVGYIVGKQVNKMLGLV